MRKNILYIISVFTILLISGCGGMRPTLFLYYDYNFDYVEKVAIIPFENLSKDQGAGARVTRLFTSELLSKNAFDIIEPGEVKKILKEYSLIRTSELTTEQIIEIGNKLKVQSLFLGSVNESTTSRSSSAKGSVVTIIVRMVEVEEGTTIWSATNTEGGRGFWGSLFGAGVKSKSEITRKCISKIIRTLVK